MKRILSMFLAVALVLSLVPAAMAAGAGEMAYQSTQTVDVDGKKVEFQCYALKDAAGNDTNYIKLRDLAKILNGTGAQFEVGWNGAVNIETGKAYTADGTEMNTPFSGARAYEVSTAPTNVNGGVAPLDAIVLKDNDNNGYTYYKLRDLGTALGIKVDWSAERGIFIETTDPADSVNVTIFATDSDKTMTVPVSSVETYMKQGWSTAPHEITLEDYFQVEAGADDFVAETSGTAGESSNRVTWEYGDGCLVLGGEGKLHSQNHNWTSKIKEVYFKRGVTIIGEFRPSSYAVEYSDLTRVEIPDTWEEIEKEAFVGCKPTRVGIPDSVSSISDGGWTPSTAFGHYSSTYDKDGNEVRKLDNQNLVIYCVPGSTASEFANEYNVRQVAATQVFYPDGRTCMVSAEEKPEYLKKGWYDHPVVMMYNEDGSTQIVDEAVVYTKDSWGQSISDFKMYYSNDGEVKAMKWTPAVGSGWSRNIEDTFATVYAADGRTLTVLKGAVADYEKAGWYGSEAEAKVTMYAPDGRTKEVWPDEVEANEKVGWYRNRADVYVTMYAPDGRTKEVPKGQVEANKAVGWYEKAVTTLYAADGRTRVTYTDEVDAYVAAGWYTRPVTLMYAADGRTMVVYSDQVGAYEKVGWYRDKEKIPGTNTPAASGRIALTLDNYKEYLTFNAFLEDIDVQVNWNSPGYFDVTCRAYLQCTPKQYATFENVTVRFYLESSTEWANWRIPTTGYGTVAVPFNGIATSRSYSTSSLVNVSRYTAPSAIWNVHIVGISGYVNVSF